MPLTAKDATATEATAFFANVLAVSCKPCWLCWPRVGGGGQEPNNRSTVVARKCVNNWTWSQITGLSLSLIEEALYYQVPVDSL